MQTELEWGVGQSAKTCLQYLQLWFCGFPGATGGRSACAGGATTPGSSSQPMINEAMYTIPPHTCFGVCVCGCVCVCDFETCTLQNFLVFFHRIMLQFLPGVVSLLTHTFWVPSFPYITSHSPTMFLVPLN